MTNLAFGDNFKSLKAPFNENLNLFVLFLFVKAKLVIARVAPAASTLNTAVGFPVVGSGGGSG
jgi:hypothetical protein